MEPWFMISLVGLAVLNVIEAKARALRWTRSRQRQFADKIQPLLQAKYGTSFGRAFHVGIAPGFKRRRYQGQISWDIGFMEVSDRLHYWGDRVSFSLSPAQIRSVRVSYFGFCDSQVDLELVEKKEGDSEIPRFLQIHLRGQDSTSHVMAVHRLRTQILLLAGKSDAEFGRLPAELGVSEIVRG